MAKKKKRVYDFQPRMPDGSRSLHLRFDTLEEKQNYVKAFNEKRRKIIRGEQLNASIPILADFAQAWLVKRERSILEGKITLAGWEPNERHARLYIIPALGNIPLDQITTEVVEEFIEGLKGKIGPATRNRVRGTLSALFNDPTVRRSFGIKANPVTDVEKENEKAAKRKTVIIHSLDDAKNWLAEAYKLGPMWGCLETLLLNGGPRKSQVIPLRWGDWDLSLSRLWMGRMWEQASRTIQNRTKGREEDESFYMGVNDVLAESLRHWKGVSQWTESGDYIFSLKKGKYLDPNSIDIRHNKLRKVTGIDMTFHDGRHTYGSHFISQGGSLDGAQAQLGHKSRKTTEEFYKHAVKKDLRTMANVAQLGEIAVKDNLDTKLAPKAQAQSEDDSQNNGSST